MSKVKNELRNRGQRIQPKNEILATDPATLTTGFRHVVVNKDLDLILADIKDKGITKHREYRMKDTRFVMIDTKSVIANSAPSGLYIHMDCLLNFISRNLFGMEHEPQKVVVPEKQIIIPGR